MRRVDSMEPTELVLEKPSMSTFSAHFIVLAMLPDGYASRIDVTRGYYAIQVATLKWLSQVLKAYARCPPATAAGILNSDNFHMMQQELRDSAHVAQRVSAIVDQALVAPPRGCRTIHDVLVPLLNGASFWGNEDEMIAFFQTLEHTSSFLQQVRRHALGLLSKKSAVRYLLTFERSELGRHARSSVTQALTLTNVAYGGAPMIAAFGLAMMRQAWAELKIEIFTQITLPNFNWK